MKLSNRAKIGILFIGDIAALYAALVLTLVLRYGGAFYRELLLRHALPFSLAFALWLLVFYIAGLYDLPRLRNNIDFIKTLLVAIISSALFTIALFYFVPAFGIAPKTNLFLFMAFFAAVEVWWRRTFNIRASFREGLNRVLLIDHNPQVDDIKEELAKNPQVGYEIAARLKRGLAEVTRRTLHDLVHIYRINLIVVPRAIKGDPTLSQAFYELLTSGIAILDTTTFYEVVFRKVPLSAIDEAWFLEHHIGEKKFYDELKRGLECIAAVLLLLLFLPLGALVSVAIKATSPGSVIYRQVRLGKHGRPFVLYKFRTMRHNAEEHGPRWAEDGDSRQTLVGRLLRASHLDEFPQLWNIMRGDLSFVGPRPERPEFVTMLEDRIPFYETRHLVPPGVTGWAQINYRYGASEEDATAKLEYDIYYLKNRSLILDIAIIIKTIKNFFVNPK